MVVIVPFFTRLFVSLFCLGEKGVDNKVLTVIYSLVYIQVNYKVLKKLLLSQVADRIVITVGWTSTNAGHQRRQR